MLEETFNTLKNYRVGRSETADLTVDVVVSSPKNWLRKIFGCRVQTYSVKYNGEFVLRGSPEKGVTLYKPGYWQVLLEEEVMR
jgi:hypothetical protein